MSGVIPSITMFFHLLSVNAYIEDIYRICLEIYDFDTGQDMLSAETEITKT